MGLLRYILLMLVINHYHLVQSKNVDCDPCIKRHEYKIMAIVHGTSLDSFWQQMRLAAIQAAFDFRIDFQMNLRDNFDVLQMAEDINSVTKSYKEGDRVDALIVTVPSEDVHQAIKDAVAAGIPVFGFNSGLPYARDLGMSSFVGADEYIAGAEAAETFLSKSRSFEKAIFANHEKGNFALEQRYEGFRDRLLQSLDSIEIKEVIISLESDNSDKFGDLENEVKDCAVDLILLGGQRHAEKITSILASNGCSLSDTMMGTFDTNSQIYANIATGKFAFTVSQQPFLQAYLSVAFASMYAITGKKLADSSLESSSGAYLTGPKIISLENLPLDSRQLCESESFPTCRMEDNQNMMGEVSMELSNFTYSKRCDCFDRKSIKLGGVIHALEYVDFWDPLFAVAFQTSEDLGIQLTLDRFSAQESSETLNDKMASKMLNFCSGGVDGLFISIPSENVLDAVKRCKELDVPMLSVNAGADYSQEYELFYHIAQLEYSAGYAAGQRMAEENISNALCLNHEPFNTVTKERCAGFEKAIIEAGITYLGELDIPEDSKAIAFQEIEAKIGTEGDWEGYGVMLLGTQVLPPLLDLKASHPKLTIGTFDVSDDLYEALEDDLVLFGINQEPYLQGIMPVILLTILTQTGQHLINPLNDTAFIETGPAMIESSQSKSQEICEANFYKVCPDEDLYNFHYVTKVRPVALSLACTVFLTSIGLILWVLKFKHKRVVKVSQPFFLIMVCVGAFTMCTTIIPLSMDDNLVKDEARLNLACRSIPWLFSFGFTISFSALFSKIWRINLILTSAAKFRRLRVTPKDVLLPFLVLLFFNVCCLTIWTVVDPMYWQRSSYCGSDNLDTYGMCVRGEGPISLIMLVMICLINAIPVFLANIQAYKARKVSTELNESKNIQLLMAGFVQICVVGIPILGLVYTNPSAYLSLWTLLLFVMSISMLTAMFIPKMIQLRKAAKSKKDNRATVSGLSTPGKYSSANNMSTRDSDQMQFKINDEEHLINIENISKFVMSLQDEGIETERLLKKAGIDAEKVKLSIESIRNSFSDRKCIDSVNIYVNKSDVDGNDDLAVGVRFET